MALQMVGLIRSKNGELVARKGIPADVRDAYSRLYNVRWEAQLRLPPGVAQHEAKRRYAEWIGEIETRIATLRAEARGEGQPLTKLNAIALAGHWYTWFIAQHEDDPGPQKHWREMGDHLVWQVIYPEAPDEYLENPKADPHWEWAKEPEVRQSVRPQIAEMARVATFLASEGLALNDEAYVFFVDAVSDNLYLRIFHNGDDPHFDWNLGGRLYSQHFSESYQVLSADRRAAMTINGEPVAEIDLRASYLTIFLSLHGIQLDTKDDPYRLDGLGTSDRFAVKAWMVATFGNTKPIRKWPPKMLQKSPELKNYRVATITKAALAKYPELRAWGQPLNGRVRSWADLMWLESAVMVQTMLDLIREFSVPSLSVHDSLIVPASKADIAAQRLARKFHGVTRVQPLLKINQLSREKN
jgi:hypothetical protein